MRRTVEIFARLNVRVPAGHPVMAKNQAVVRKTVDDYVGRLLAGLGVPGAVQLTWEKQAPRHQAVELFINGTAARLRHATSRNMAVSPADYAISLCEDILRNRGLFATPEAVDAATGEAPPFFRSLEEKDQIRIAQVLFKQGFGLSRIAQYTPPDGISDSTPEAWAEACVGDLEATRLVMHAHAGQIDPDDDPHDLNRLIESAGYFVEAAFRVKGIPFPKISASKRDDFAPDEMAFQINDLLFPVWKIGDIQQENLRFVNFLANNGVFFLNRGSVNFLLDSLAPAHPNLLALARTRFSTDFIVTILRNLVSEGISIRSLVRILEILAGGGQDVYQQSVSESVAPPQSEIVHLIATDKTTAQLDLSDWTELVRMNLKNAIINRALPHFEESLLLSCFYPETAFFEKIARFESLDPAERAELLETLHRRIAEDYLTPAGKIRPVVTSAAWRKKISDMIAFEFPETPVFSLQECLPRIVARFDAAIPG